MRLADITPFPLLVLERGSTSRQLLDAALVKGRVCPSIAMELGGIEVLKRFVEIGLWLAVIHRSPLRRRSNEASSMQFDLRDYPRVAWGGLSDGDGCDRLPPARLSN